MWAKLLSLGRRYGVIVISEASSAGTPPAGFATIYLASGVLTIGLSDGSTITVGGGAPSGPATGDLDGSFPGPTVTRARGLRTSGGTTIPMGAVQEGHYLKVSGGSVVGVYLALALGVSAGGIELDGPGAAYPSLTSSPGTVA